MILLLLSVAVMASVNEQTLGAQLGSENTEELKRLAEEETMKRAAQVESDREMAFAMQAEWVRDLPDDHGMSLAEVLKEVRPYMAPVIASYLAVCAISKTTPGLSSFSGFVTTMIAAMAVTNGVLEPNGYVRTDARALLRGLRRITTEGVADVRRRIGRPF